VVVGFGLCTGNQTNANAKYLLVREGAENDLLVRQCTFVHAAAYCHTRDATQRCQFSELRPENVAQLRAHIVKLCRALSEDLCRKVVTNARVRLQEFVRQNGGHIEHVLH